MQADKVGEALKTSSRYDEDIQILNWKEMKEETFGKRICRWKGIKMGFK